LSATALVAVLAGGLYLFRHPHKAVALSDQATIVVADFTNTTGDRLFDSILREGLSSQLVPSRYFKLLPDAPTGSGNRGDIAQLIHRANGFDSWARLTSDVGKAAVEQKCEARLFLNLTLFKSAEDRPDFRNHSEQKGG
jgi:hypothetical protein